MDQKHLRAALAASILLNLALIAFIVQMNQRIERLEIPTPPVDTSRWTGR